MPPGGDGECFIIVVVMVMRFIGGSGGGGGCGGVKWMAKIIVTLVD